VVNDINREKPKYSVKIPPDYHFVYYKSHMDWLAVELWPPR